MAVFKVESQRWGNCTSALGLQTGGFGPWSLFMKLEVWERWISIMGGAGTAFPCVQRHFKHWFTWWVGCYIWYSEAITHSNVVNPLTGTLKPQRPLHSNTVIGTLPLMGRLLHLLLHLVQREGAWAGCDPAQSPPRCTKCNNPPINGQCTNFILVDAAILLPEPIKGFIRSCCGFSRWEVLDVLTQCCCDSRCKRWNNKLVAIVIASTCIVHTRQYWNWLRPVTVILNVLSTHNVHS